MHAGRALLGMLCAAALATGCSPEPRNPEGGGCSESRPCPDGFRCGDDGLCLQESAATDGGGEEADAGPVDAPSDAGPGDAGAVQDAGPGRDPCAGVGCSGHGRCVAENDLPRCVCDPDFHAVQLRCEADGPAPTAAFTLSAASATVQQELTLDASTSTGTGLSWRWDFESDGHFDTEWASAATLRHRWRAPATYTVRLEVRDAAGRSASATRTLEVAWFGQPAWVGIANNTPGEYGWWTVLDFQAGRLSDTEVHATDTRSYTKVRFPRQISDGRVLLPVECLAEFTCAGHEVAIVGAAGRTGTLGAFTWEFKPVDVLELPGGTFLVSGREKNAIIELNEDGEPLDYWARNLRGPTGLALTADGAGVLVAQSNGARVDRFSLRGAPQGRWDAPGHLGTPYALVRTRAGRYLVSDTSGAVVEFEADGRHVATLLQTPAVRAPTGLAELPDGRLLVGENCTTTDDRCGEVKVFDRPAARASTWAPPPGVAWVVVNPEGMVVVNR